MPNDEPPGFTPREREALRDLARASLAASWTVRNLLRMVVALAAVIAAYNALKSLGVNIIEDLKNWIR